MGPQGFTGLLAEPAFWTAIAFIIFVVVLLIAKVPGALARSLDARAAGIKAEIEQAQHLRTEAEALLKRYRAQEAQAAKETESILAEARAEAARLGIEAREELSRALDRRRKQAEEKIERAQEEAVADIRNYSAKVAVGAATRYIRDKMDGAKAARLIDGAIAEVPARLKSRG
jgi:F-type H+-transporting ATPase subunit b